MKHLTAAIAALALAAAPAAAAPQPIAPAPEHVEGSELNGGNAVYYILPVLIIAAILLAMTAGGDNDAKPASP
jgi:hypothetical protein